MWYRQDYFKEDRLDDLELDICTNIECSGLLGDKWEMETSWLLNSLIAGKYRKEINKKAIIDSVNAHLLNYLMVQTSQEKIKIQFFANDSERDEYNEYCKCIKEELIELINEELKITESSEIILTKDDLVV